MIGFDIDGVLYKNGRFTDLWTSAQELRDDEVVIISGRTFKEYNDVTKKIAQHYPVYIRGAGEFGNAQEAGWFKTRMIIALGVDRFYEDDPVQAEIIQKAVTGIREDFELVRV